MKEGSISKGKRVQHIAIGREFHPKLTPMRKPAAAKHPTKGSLAKVISSLCALIQWGRVTYKKHSDTQPFYGVWAEMTSVKDLGQL
ncbi:hypothetical protein VNO78_00961 [Psophocarpus tetragonolobus]|uniref:Uncharacterized protein n=1 Tax=Psophocarpus tetragonolobus TaxID=3891 RepID=A0AAN9SYL2_PSOTE